MNDALDLARLSCQDEEIIFQLSKLLESINIQTSIKGYAPLTSVTSYLLQATPDQREQYFREIDHNQPYDMGYIKIMLLGKHYKYFQQFIIDLNQCFDHYEKVKDQYKLPDILLEAKTHFYQTISLMNFAGFLEMQFHDELVRQIIETDSSTLGDPIKVLTSDEVRFFMFLTETFDDDQIDRVEEKIKLELGQYEYSSTKSGDDDQIQLNLNSIYPEKARKFMRIIQEKIATKEQVDKTRVRMEYWNQLYQSYYKKPNK